MKEVAQLHDVAWNLSVSRAARVPNFSGTWATTPIQKFFSFWFLPGVRSLSEAESLSAAERCHPRLLCSHDSFPPSSRDRALGRLVR